jgi:hypothetical protein
MTRSINPQEAQIILSLERTTLLAIDLIRHKRLGGECRLSRVVDDVGDVVVAEPVADPAAQMC